MEKSAVSLVRFTPTRQHGDAMGIAAIHPRAVYHMHLRPTLAHTLAMFMRHAV